MLPRSSLPPVPAFATAKGVASHVATLAGEGGLAAASMATWVQRLIVTSDGRILDVLALPRGAKVAIPFPTESDQPIGQATGFDAGADATAMLSALLIGRQWLPLRTDHDGAGYVEVQVLARPCGWSQAVPFSCHHTGASKQWQCFGGLIRSDARDNGSKQVRVAHALLTGDAGMIGLRYEFAGGAGPDEIVIKAARWEFIDSTSSSSTLGAVVDGVRGAGSEFAALFAVDQRDGVRLLPFGFRAPAVPGDFSNKYYPSGIGGSLLT